MREGRAILDRRAEAMSEVPAAELIERYEDKTTTEQITSRSGLVYRLSITARWDMEPRESDFFVWLSLRAPTGLRRLWPWRATLFGSYPEKKFPVRTR
jgi:hypothetical protein